MNRIIPFLLILCLIPRVYSEERKEKITVEWIQSDEAKAIAAVHRYQWLENNTAILFDVRKPKEERTFQKLDPWKAGELYPVVNREKAIASLQRSIGDEDSTKYLVWPIAFDSNGEQALYIYKKDIFILDMATSEFRRITETETAEKSPRFSPDGSKVAFVRENDIYVYDLEKTGKNGLPAMDRKLP